MTNSTEIPPSVRAFKSESEIRILSYYRDSNPVTAATYEKLLGHYDLPEEAFNCCYQEDGKAICNEPHKWGFLALLKDGSAATLGNSCARTKFAKDAAGFKRDLAHYENQRSRLEALNRLRILVSEKDVRLEKLNDMHEALSQLNIRISLFINKYGRRTQNRILQIARSEAANINVLGISIRHYEEGGKSKTERLTKPIKLGSINGLKLLNVGRLRLLLDKFKPVTDAFRKAEQVADSARTTDLNRLSVSISDGDSILIEGQAFLDLELSFKATDLSLFCFLVDDRFEQIQAAIVALGLSGSKKANQATATEWLTAKHRKLMVDESVDLIQI